MDPVHNVFYQVLAIGGPYQVVAQRHAEQRGTDRLGLGVLFKIPQLYQRVDVAVGGGHVQIEYFRDAALRQDRGFPVEKRQNLQAFFQ